MIRAGGTGELLRFLGKRKENAELCLVQKRGKRKLDAVKSKRRKSDVSHSCNGVFRLLDARSAKVRETTERIARKPKNAEKVEGIST